MRAAYIAIGYFCNQKCRFCPCSKEETAYPAVSWEDYTDIVTQMRQTGGIDTLVISGGEPTLHPEFLRFVQYAVGQGMELTVLSNSERFADEQFVRRLADSCDVRHLQVITTIHSQSQEQHEWVNQTAGSFQRTIRGLKNLNRYGVHVTVKHCITRLNQMDLRAFYQFIDREFPPEVDIQMCSIDYCGLQEEDKLGQRVVFPELAPYFEEMFDAYLQDLADGGRRHMYCINMPLCSADPYYWQFFKQKSDGYSEYASPDSEGDARLSESVENNTGTFGEACRACKAEELCPGTYRTAFAYFGDSIIAPYADEEADNE